MKVANAQRIDLFDTKLSTESRLDLTLLIDGQPMPLAIVVKGQGQIVILKEPSNSRIVMENFNYPQD